jgi:hypothetical protein
LSRKGVFEMGVLCGQHYKIALDIIIICLILLMHDKYFLKRKIG